VRAILEAQPNYQVVAEAPNGKESGNKPDIAIVDYALPVVAARMFRSSIVGNELDGG